jgi:hypothetical protein
VFHAGDGNIHPCIPTTAGTRARRSGSSSEPRDHGALRRHGARSAESTDRDREVELHELLFSETIWP